MHEILRFHDPPACPLCRDSGIIPVRSSSHKNVSERRGNRRCVQQTNRRDHKCCHNKMVILKPAHRVSSLNFPSIKSLVGVAVTLPSIW